MVLIRKPFTTTRLDEERAKDRSEVITLKLNAVEREDLEADKELLDLGGDSQAIKLLVSVGRKVIRDTFSADTLKYLVSLRRTRYDGKKRKSAGTSRAQSNTFEEEKVTLSE